MHHPVLFHTNCKLLFILYNVQFVSQNIIWVSTIRPT